MATKTAKSSSVSEVRSGSVREYRVASPRNTTSADIAGARSTSSWCVVELSPPPWRRERHTAIEATRMISGQPTPTSTLFAPVMLARASEHGLAPPGSGTHCPPLAS